ncbi:MAG: crossover junction endodeoxyribonuclease RuvC [Candidatus Omnitrophica bacterium]|nr:crossover junction endodeoxyribonuclease RuvC [Candidatus Omnitrophota bacterium]
MRILGIDPALSITGYGAIETSKKGFALLEAGIIRTSAKDEHALRLDKIYREVMLLISDTKPQVIVLEKIFAHYRHPTTSYILGQARGVICLAAQRSKVPLVEYAATRIKKSIIGKGLAAKYQVQKMVQSQLGLKTLPKYTDVTDALALAIGHSYISRALNQTIKR